MMTRLALNMVLNISAVAETRSLTELFGSDPVSWLNWVLVFGVLALSFYLLVFKLWSKINYFFSLERKIQRAQSRNHITRGQLLRYTKNRRRDEETRQYKTTYQAWYAYEADGVRYEKRIPMHTLPSQTLQLFWLNSPRHVFHAGTRLWRQPLGCLYLILIFAAFAIAGWTGVWLGVISV